METATATVNTIRRHVDENAGIEYLLFTVEGDTSDKPYRVRVRDTDVDENVSIVFYPSLEMADAKFSETIAAIQSQEDRLEAVATAAVALISATGEVNHGIW